MKILLARFFSGQKITSSVRYRSGAMDDGTLTTRKRNFAASKNEINGLGGKPNKIVKLYIYEIAINDEFVANKHQ